MIPSTPFDHLRQIWDDPSFSYLRSLKSHHPDMPLVGTFPVWTPHEIIHAGNAHPFLFLGGGTWFDIEFADARMQSFICSISRSTLELGLREKLDFVDGAVFPSICDVARNLSGVWQRNFPAQKTIYLHLPENIESPAAEDYLISEFKRLVSMVEELSGHTITDDDLKRSIELYNNIRTTIKQLYDERSTHPQDLSLYELMMVLRAGTLLKPEEFKKELENALEVLRSRHNRPKDRIRVFLEGGFCEQPPIEFIWALEEAGCDVIYDDFLLGMKYLTQPVPVDGEPLRNLARTYLRHARESAIRYDGPTARVDHFIERVKDANVDGVIFTYAKFCDPAQFDVVLLRQRLEESGIPSMAVEFEEKMSIFEDVRNQVETFVESILFYAV